MVRMAFNKSMLFCSRLGKRLSGPSVTARVSFSGTMASGSCFRGLEVSSDREGSEIGQTKPVLGV